MIKPKRGKHQIIVGDCLAELAKLPANHFHCCMTSPPYFALRSYLPSGHPSKDLEIGSEPTPDEFIETMVTVFREVKRVLRDDGFLWINLGDSYGGSWGNYSGGGRGQQGQRPISTGSLIDNPAYANVENIRPATSNQPAGNQLLMPHRVALALQADGWVLRDTVIWAKRSPMPSSQNGVRWERCRVKVAGTTPEDWREKGAVRRGVNADGKSGGNTGIKQEQAKWSTCPGCPKCIPNGGYVLRRGQGRTTTSHEYLFLFTKGNDYFRDMENGREDAKCPNDHNGQSVAKGVFGGKGGNGDGREMRQTVRAVVQKRIPRSVWTLSSEPTKFNHFATYPSDLVRRCLMPLSPRGCCPTCGAQWAPVVESERIPTRPALNNKIWKHADGDRVGQRSDDSPNLDPERHIVNTKVIGYRQTCNCPAADPVPCRTIDIFSGTGTTGQTACFLGHDYVGIELNPDYAAHANDWINREPRWSLRQKIKAAGARKAIKPAAGQGLLF